MFDFLPFGRRTDPADPLDSLKTVTQWMGELPLGDVYGAHEKVVLTTTDLIDRTGPLTHERLQMLTHLDEGAQQLQESLCSQYLLNPRMSRTIENRLWNAVFSFNWQMARGYHAFVMAYVSDPGSKFSGSVPLIAVRAIRYFAMQAKWRYFRYERVPDKFWKHVHNLYRLAEHEGFANESQVLYSGQAATTCADEYLQLLSLDIINTGNLYPKQIDMVDRWLDHWSHTLKLEKDYVPGQHVFCVNLGDDRGARRVRKLSNDAMIRYWGTGELMALVEQTKTDLQKGGVPASLGLGEDCRLPGCLEFLDRVVHQWAAAGVSRVQRKSERVPSVKAIDVVKGFAEICARVKDDNERQVKKAQGDDSLSYEELVDVRMYGFVTRRTQDKTGPQVKSLQSESAAERWLMQNESKGGFGAIIETAQNDWVKLGKLVGLKPEKAGHWVVGVARRLSQLPTGQCYVGIETLAHQPLMVLLRPQKPRRSGYTIDGIDAVDAVLSVCGLYLSSKDGDRHVVSLLMDSAEYARGRHFEFVARNRSYLISLTDVMEKGDGWVRTGFEVVARQ